MYLVSGVKMNVVHPTSTAHRMTSLLRVHIHTVLCKVCDNLLQGGDGMRDMGGDGMRDKGGDNVCVVGALATGANVRSGGGGSGAESVAGGLT